MKPLEGYMFDKFGLSYKKKGRNVSTVAHDCHHYLISHTESHRLVPRTPRAQLPKRTSTTDTLVSSFVLTLKNFIVLKNPRNDICHPHLLHLSSDDIRGRSMTSPNMDAFRGHNMALIGGILLLATGASAHGGHMEELPEGQFMSEDPIVR
jgi:hypothetical protein